MLSPSAWWDPAGQVGDAGGNRGRIGIANGQTGGEPTQTEFPTVANSLSLYHCDVLAALFIRLNQFGNTVVEGGEFALVVLSQR